MPGLSRPVDAFRGLFPAAGYIGGGALCLALAGIVGSRDVSPRAKVAHCVLGLVALVFFVLATMLTSVRIIQW